MIIDFSSHDTWGKCPAMWYEKYVNKRRKHWPSAQRDDALALGSLVHEGLRQWQETHTVGIPQGVQEEVTPTKECFDLALELVYGYTRAYPEETWPLIVCEEPVRFPLNYGEPVFWWVCTACNESHKEAEEGIKEFLTQHAGCNATTRLDKWPQEPLDGLAKIDSYFYVPEYTEIETGMGFRQTVQPGWWIHEYKTKSPFITAGHYMQSWQMGLQASYQISALGHKIASEPEESWRRAGQPSEYHGQVQGVLVNVLEKPKRYVPKRKCQACKESYEFATWLPTGTGLYACPVCGNKQTLTPLKEATPAAPPTYYRICVTRTPEELARDKREMIQVGQRMLAMQAGGLYSEPWAHHACVDFRWRRACDYFGCHKNFVSTLEDPEFEPIPDYRGLTQLEEVSE